MTYVFVLVLEHQHSHLLETVVDPVASALLNHVLHVLQTTTMRKH